MSVIPLLLIWFAVGFLMSAIAYAIHFKKDYSLLSGYYSYSEEEKMELEKNGYFGYMGRFILWVDILFIVLFPLAIFPVPYGMEIFLIVFLLYIMIGSLYGIKKEPVRTRKRNGIILTVTYTLVLGGIGFLFYYSNQGTVITVTESKISIEGMYDDTFRYNDIEEVTLIEDIPDNLIKSNGYASSTRLLGSFRSKKYGPSRYFVFKEYPPYIALKTKDKYVFINSRNQAETEKWYKEINEYRSR